MVEEKARKMKDRFVWVKDKEGKEFVCPIDALKNPDELTEEEKAHCIDSGFDDRTKGSWP